MKAQWCWRCKMNVPMLDDEEFEQIRRVAEETAEQNSGTLPAGASKLWRAKAMLDRYNRLTGFGETNINAVWHHRTSIYGPPCPRCGKVLRTPIAYKCFECGFVVRQPDQR
jgi:hypothetical protein